MSPQCQEYQTHIHTHRPESVSVHCSGLSVLHPASLSIGKFCWRRLCCHGAGGTLQMVMMSSQGRAMEGSEEEEGPSTVVSPPQKKRALVDSQCVWTSDAAAWLATFSSCHRFSDQRPFLNQFGKLVRGGGACFIKSSNDEESLTEVSFSWTSLFFNR